MTATMSDAEYARMLESVCDYCGVRPCNPNFIYCQTCYEQHFQTIPDMDTDDVDTDDVPPEGATYEMLRAWEDARNDKYNTEKQALSNSWADRFPTRMSNDKDGSCSICLDSYEPNVSIMTINCLHSFHESCMRQWIKQSAAMICPVCQHDNSTDM